MTRSLDSSCDTGTSNRFSICN